MDRVIPHRDRDPRRSSQPQRADAHRAILLRVPVQPVVGLRDVTRGVEGDVADEADVVEGAEVIVDDPALGHAPAAVALGRDARQPRGDRRPPVIVVLERGERGENDGVVGLDRVPVAPQRRV